jgi:eukaryotic-like serine/threonine-protein kinase
MIGTTLGNYRVTSRLGEGGMGTVYRATDAMLDRDVAIKVLRPELARQTALVDRFRAEAIALARLRHEHIAALYGLERHGDDLVMVMEFVAGETLEARIHRDGALNWRDALPIMRQVLAALGHAHHKGVVHRDIKPANVMVDPDGVVKVMDFGIARLMGENRQTRAGVAVGTPSYMAPEQLRGEDVDGRTDLYAVGALLFEVLTGRVAFEADSDYSLMMQQLNEAPPAPSSLARGVPKAVDAAVLRAMAKKPAQRFGSATDFSRVLDGIAPESAITDPLRDVASTVATRMQRDWRVYAIAGCVLGAAVLSAAALRRSQAPVPLVQVADSVTTRELPPVAANTPRYPVSATPSAMDATKDTATPAEIAPAGTQVAPGVRAPNAVASPVGAPTQPPTTRDASRDRTPKRTSVDANTTPTPARTATPVKASPVEPPITSRATEVESSPGAERRLAELATRCTEALEDNDADEARAVLRGATGGIVSALNDGRIGEADRSDVDVSVGNDEASGRFSVRVSWRTAFGGNKSGTVRMVATATRSGSGWRAQGCSVLSDGGLR